MFPYFLHFKNFHSKSVRFKSLDVHRIVSYNKSSLASERYLKNPRQLQLLFKKLKINDVLRRNLSTSSSLFNKKNDPDKKNDPNNSEFAKIARMISTAIFVYVMAQILFRDKITNKDQELHNRLISWEEFKNDLLLKGEVKEIVVDMSQELVFIFVHNQAVVKDALVFYGFYVLKVPDPSKFEAKLRETERQLGINPSDAIPIYYKSDRLFYWFLILLVATMLWFLSSKKGHKIPFLPDFMGLTRAKFTLVDPLSGQGKGVKFSDVAGLKEAKIEIMEFVDYLKSPERYTTLGAKVPKGALLLGPPGCGKTLLAKAVATEANVPFLSMNGSEFIEMIGGLGAARVRDLFSEAKKRIPCIVYIDEIDAIGKKRGSGMGAMGNEEGEQTLNQLLVEMDGMVSNEGVVLLASTNRAEVLDKALLRPGRFDRHILIDLPTFEERRQIFEQHLKAIQLEHEPSYYSKRLAYLTPGFTGADIANVCNEAALHAARMDKRLVQGDDLEYAVERVVGGTEKRSSALSREEKEILAYHEAGRALVGWLSKNGEHLLKVTIVARTHSPAGRTQFTQGDKFLYSKNELLGKMGMGLAGRVAVSLIFNKVTTRGESDLKKVTRLAYAQLKRFGMNQTVGLMSFGDSNKEGELMRKPYSKALAALYDEEARKLVATIYRETEEILVNNKDKLILVAKALIENETLNYDDLVKLLGPPPYKKKLIEPFEFELSLNQAAGPEPSPPVKHREKKEFEEE